MRTRCRSTSGDGMYEPPPLSEVGNPNLYGPFYGGPYVPMPVLDRHRTRVKS